MTIWAICFKDVDDETLNEYEATLTKTNGPALFDSYDKAKAECDKLNKGLDMGCYPKELFVM